MTLPLPARAAAAYALLLALVGCSNLPTEPTSAGIPTGAPREAPMAAVSTTPLITLPDPAPAASAATPTLDAVPITPSEVAAAPRIGALRDAIDPALEYPDDRADLWQRVRSGFAMADLDNDNVRKWEQWYATRPDYVQRMTERGGRYLFHIVEEVERRGMPTELALLPFIESAFNPQAKSSASASGMWQFMPATGKDFELKQNLFRDDRRDVLASTRAALDYLQLLHKQFGDWHHVLAAYNWGQGNLQRAIARNQKGDAPVDYDSLRMPDETRNYVPKLQAVKNIVLRPEAFALTLPRLQNHPFFLSVAIERDIDVALAARLAGLSLDDFQQLNPQMNKPVILAAGTPQLLLPYDNANHFVRELQRHRGPLATWTAWVAPRTVKPAEAARAVGMSEAELREVNRIPPRMLVRAGSTLLVPRSAKITADVDEHVADTAAMVLSPELVAARMRKIKVGPRGATVADVARQHGVSPAQLARWNRVPVTARLRPGQSLLIALPAARPAAKGSTRSAASAPAKRKAAGAPAKRKPQAVAPARPRVAQH